MIFVHVLENPNETRNIQAQTVTIYTNVTTCDNDDNKSESILAFFPVTQKSIWVHFVFV